MLQDTIRDNENVQVNSKEMEALKEHFPQCFDKNGNFDMAIFEELVKTKDVSIKKEGYALNFLGKSYARYLSNLDSETVIVPDESNKDNPSENIYIVGDNLDALQHLKHSYAGAIKCIYIDPPYNTGSDGFVYNDKFEFSAKDLAEKIGIEEDEAERILNMQGKSTHSAWLTFMYPRLELAKELLTEDGAIFISLDDNEITNCKLLCDLIFGEGNFIGQVTVVANPRGRDYGGVARMNDYLLIYRKSDLCHINLIDDPEGEFTCFDALGGFEIRELRNRNKKFNKENRPNLYYPFYIDESSQDEHGLFNISLEPKDGLIEHYPLASQGVNTVWRWGKEKAQRNLNINIKAKRMRNGGYQIVEKYREPKKMARSVWWEKGTNTEKGTLLVKELFEGKTVFDYPKPIELIQKIIQMGTNDETENIILDFFSGSASTAHSVMQYNLIKETMNNFILVQLDEPVKQGSEAEKAGYKTIDEIGRERIRRAAAKIRADEPEKSKDVDLGFKTYYLKTPEKQTLDKMESFNPEFPMDRDDILAAFGKDTVLSTWAIKDGYGFNTPIKEIDLKGYTAYFINDGIHGANLYLLDEISEPSIMELVRRLEANELVADKIIVYGYALSFTASTSLRTNLKTLKNRNSIDVAIRY